MYNVVLTFRDAYLEYVLNYPIAAYQIDNKMVNSSQFEAFIDVSFQPPLLFGLDWDFLISFFAVSS